MAWLKRGHQLTWCFNRSLRYRHGYYSALQFPESKCRPYHSGIDPSRPNQRKKEQNALTSKHIRQSFLDFFTDNDHIHVPSSSIMPRAGEGTYFTNAGMNQFKPIFLGTVDPSSRMAGYQRAVNSQRCVRVGGKHNDLADVGKDTSHHTFFEMLGSWSFGDYFKKVACSYAWELLTNVYHIPPKHLYVTYFGGDEKLNLEADLECRDIWLELGVPSERVIASGVVDNFWDMGMTGPCGPCTEIHYAYNPSGRLAHLVNTGNPAVMEIWNLVFMQFDRQVDGSLVALPKHHVDTGMGLERLTAVLQGVKSNYDTDLFTPIFQQIHHNCSCPPYGGQILDHDKKGIDTAYRIVADHMRMVTIALADGLRPGPKDQGSKLRQILYRALRQSRDVLRAPPSFLSSLIPVVINTLGDAFPGKPQDYRGMKDIVDHTEEKINNMERVVAKNLKQALDYYRQKDSLTAEQVLEIHEGRFGNAVSVDILEEICLARNIKIDVENVQKVMEEHKVLSMPASRTEDDRPSLVLTQHHTSRLREEGVPPTNDQPKYTYTSDDGHYTFPPVESEIVAILCDSNFVDVVHEGEQCGVILKDTCFYAESGGQKSDTGYMRKDDGSNLQVEDVESSSGYVLHTCTIHKGSLSVGDSVKLSINQSHRQGSMCNHTATHIVNYALEKTLGNVRQQGSVVSSNKFTFDFSCSKVEIEVEDIEQINVAANNLLHENLPVYKEEINLEKSQHIPGLRTLQDEDYPSTVRVISIGAPVDRLLMPHDNQATLTHSVELCGGTHVDNTGDLESLVITNFKGVSQGTRRVTGVTGAIAKQALEDYVNLKQRVRELGSDILSDKNHENWQERCDYIEKRLSDGTLLPKLGRDALQASLEQIKHQTFSQSKNISIKEKLAEQIQLVLALHTSKQTPLVTEFPFPKARDVVAVLANMAPESPIMLLSQPSTETSNKNKLQLIFGVCYVPEKIMIKGTEEGFTAKSWARHVALNCQGTYHDPKGKLGKNREKIQVIAFPASERSISHAKDLARTFADLYQNI